MHKIILNVSGRLAYLYLEHESISVEDGRVISQSDGTRTPLKCAVYTVILCGPGVSITHEAIKVINACNCIVQWVGREGLTMYSATLSSTNSMRNGCTQLRKIYSSRYVLWNRMLDMRNEIGQYKYTENPKELLMVEASFMKKLYEDLAVKNGIERFSRIHRLSDIPDGDNVNRVMTLCNCALYSVATSVLLSRGFLPQIAVVHSGGSCPMAYDLADMVKAETSIPFAMTHHTGFPEAKEMYAKFSEFIEQYGVPGKMSKILDSLFL